MYRLKDFKLNILEEKELIDQAKSNPARFEELYNNNFQQIYLFIYKRVDDKQIAADLASQVFLNALTHLKKYHHRGVPFSAWLFKIATNELHVYYRKQSKQRVVVLTNEIAEHIHEEASLSLENMYNRLADALQSLKLEALELIELRFFEKRSFKEIGAILEVTENNAKVKTYRVLDQLKKEMQNGKI